MARFKMEEPNAIVQEMRRIYGKAEYFFAEMTRAGAEVAAQNIRSAAPIPEIAQGVKISRTYKTPSDDGINTKVYISGYAPFKDGRTEFIRRAKSGGRKYSTTKGVPLDFLAQVYEYGTSPRFTDLGGYRGFIGKKPYFRKGFKKSQIEAAMLKKQKEISGGLLI